MTDRLPWQPRRVAGARPGPRLWVQAGTHGDEYDGIAAALDLLAITRPDELAGELLVCPLANPGAFASRANADPADGRNLNRAVPGQMDGSPTERLAWSLTRAIVSQADCFLDLHGGGTFLQVAPFALVSPSPAPAAARARALAPHLGAPFVLAPDEGFAGSFVRHLPEEGVPALVLECGGSGVLDPAAVRFHLAGARSLMAALGMLAGERREASVTPLWLRHAVEIRAEVAGLLRHAAAPGTHAGRGAVLAEIHELGERQVTTVACPVEGAVVLAAPCAPSIRPGDYLFLLGTP